LLGAAWLLARPAETFIVTDDAGVYTLGAVHLAQTGVLSYDDAGIYPLEPGRADVPAEPGSTAYWDALQDYGRQFLLPENVGTPAGTRFWGPFFQPTLFRQHTEIGFLALPKTIGALFGWVLGEQSVVWAGPALTLLSLTAFLGLLHRTGGWGLAVPASALLVLSLPQVWFGRQLLSEPFAQALVLGILWLDAEVLSTEHGRARRALMVMEALLFGLLPLTRLEGCLLGCLLLVWLLWHSSQIVDDDRDQLKWSIAALVVGQVIAALTSPAYLYSRLIDAVTQASQALVGIVVLTVVLLTMCHILPGCTRRWGQLRLWLAGARQRSWIALVVGATYCAVTVWQCLAQPLGNTFSGWLAQSWTRPALFLGTAGLALSPSLLSQGQRGSKSLASAAACLGLLYSASPYVTQVQPWALRRAVPLLLPALAMGASLLCQSALNRIEAWRPWAWWHRIAHCVYALVLLGLTVVVAQRTAPIVFHNEREGMWNQLELLNRLLEPNSLLLLDDGQIGRQIAQPLALVYRHVAYNIQETEALSAGSPVVERLLATAQTEGRRVYWLVIDTSRRFTPEGYRLTSVGGVAFDTPTLATGPNPVSYSSLTRQSFLVDVYSLIPGTVSDASKTIGHVPLGVGSYPYLVTGFYGLESDPDLGAYRWTNGSAKVTLPWPAGDGHPVSFVMTLTVSGWRPDGQPDPDVSVWAEGRLLAEQTVPADGRVTILRGASDALSNQGLADLEIEVRSDVFVPARVGMNTDERELGVKVLDLSIDAYPGETP